MKKILLFLAVILITGCQEKEKMNVSKTVLEYEYGTAMTSEEILSCLENTDEYLEEVVINLPENEEGKDYMSVGEYELEVLHGDESANIKILVKDTVSPVFNNVKESYTVEYGKSFSEEIEANDLSDVTITVDDSKVNYKKAGEYKATVKAVDVHGNETEKEFVINVKEEKEIASSNSSSSAGKETSSKPVTNNSSTSKTETGKSETSSSANKKPSSKPTSNKTETSSKDQEKEEIIFTYEDPVIDMSTHVHDGPAVANKYFTEFDDIDEWAINYRIEQCESGNLIGGAYGIAYCKCGMRYIHRFY